MRRKRLPLHPRPFDDEALSSWIMRLGHVYGLEPEQFLAHALGVEALPSGEIDRDPPAHFVETLSERTGVPPGRIRCMTLAGYTPLLIDTLQPCGGLFDAYIGQFATLAPAASQLVAPVSGLDERIWLPWIAADLLEGEYPRCCRRCLVADPVPYLRLHWRATWMASCPFHGQFLEATYVDRNKMGCLDTSRPARIAPPELTFIDGLTLTAVTTGSVQLPCGGQIHAGVWVRLLRSLVAETTRPAALLGRETYRALMTIFTERARG